VDPGRLTRRDPADPGRRDRRDRSDDRRRDREDRRDRRHRDRHHRHEHDDRFGFGFGYGYQYGAAGYPGGYPGSATLTTPGAGGSNVLANPYQDYAGSSDLQGAATALNAAGAAESEFQSARLLNQQVEQAKLDTRRKAFDEWQYERGHTPTLQTLAERAKAEELRRTLRTPTQVDILSGYALNVILDDLCRDTHGAAGPALPIDPHLLDRVNVAARGGNSVGALRAVADGEGLRWPPALRAAAFQEPTRQLDQRLAMAVTALRTTGRLSADVSDKLAEDVRQLRAELRGNVAQLSSSRYVEATRFLDGLAESVRALQHPDTPRALTGELAVEGKTVPDVIRSMGTHGLVFAPAEPGDEAAYAAVYNAFASYRNALQAPAAKE
jgi:hypothetical protein